MKSLKRLSRYTSILLSVLLMLTAVSPGITALAAEANDVKTYTYKDENIQAEVQVSGFKTLALPENATLTVKALDKDSQDENEKALYAETEASLNAKAAEQNQAVNGFTAYRFSLKDAKGNDVTPAKGSFTVKVAYTTPTEPEAYTSSASGQKSVQVYQRTEGKDEQNQTVYTMEAPKEENTKIETEETTGKVKSVEETKLTTLEPVALTWQSVNEAQPVAVANEALGTSVQSDEVQTAANAGLANNQFRYSFDVTGHEDYTNVFSNLTINFLDGQDVNKPLDISGMISGERSATYTVDNVDEPISLESLMPEFAYSYSGAMLMGENGSPYMPYISEVKLIKEGEQYYYWYNNGAQYPKNRKIAVGSDIKLYFFCYKDFEKVKTVDSVSKGVTVQMFDYEKATPGKSLGNNGYGKMTQGLVGKKLEKNENGELLPRFSNWSTLMNENFSTTGGNYKGTANNLFRQDKYDESGTFYYSSFENYAYWKGAEKNDNTKTYPFTVYNALGTPVNTNRNNAAANFFYWRGNFMPYNKITLTEPANQNVNLYDPDGNELTDEGYPENRKGETLYKTQDSYAPGAEKGNDYYFGMVVTADFSQLKDGKYNTGKDMVYNFNGDDDMWVFIDGTLVLDIGGIHDAHSGSINFATGEVTWTDWATELGRDDPNRYTKTKVTSIYQQFIDAGTVDSTQWKIGEKTTNSDGNEITQGTFADYTGHEIKIFYMERGAGASNCKMDFNLPTVEKDSISVTKKVSNINEGAYSDVDFKFKLYLQADNEQDLTGQDYIKGSDGNNYVLATDAPYSLKEGDTVLSEQEKTGAADSETPGIFTLKHGQTAYFNKIADQGKKYIVQEVGVSKSQYDELKVNGSAKDEQGNSLSKEQADGSYIVQTMPLTVGTDHFVVVENQCSGENHQALYINKKIANGSADTTFQVKVTVGGKAFNGQYKISDTLTSAPDDKEAWNTLETQKSTDENGIIGIKAGETIQIPDLPAGTNFTVEEVNLGEDYAPVAYELNDQSTVSPAGQIQQNADAKVTVINTLKDVPVNVQQAKTAVVSDWDDRTYTVDLYASHDKKSDKKADIVLALDVSGSMAWYLEQPGSAIQVKDIPEEDQKKETLDKGGREGNLNAWDYKYYALIKGEYHPIAYINDGWYLIISPANGTKIKSNISGQTNKLNGWDTVYIADGTRKSKVQAMKTSVENFVNNLKAASPESKIAFVTFANDVKYASQNLQDVKDVNLDSIFNDMVLYADTNQGAGLDRGLSLLSGDNSGLDKYMILFTDGAPSTKYKDNADKAAADVKAYRTTDEKQITLYCAGLYNKDDENGQKANLDKWASEGCSYSATSSEGLIQAFSNIFAKITYELKDVTIKDTIDPRFDVVDASGNILGDGAAVSGGTLHIPADGNAYVEWTNQTLSYSADPKGGWTAQINLKAKDNYIGGNNVTTNVGGDASSITVGEQTTPFDQPAVNVKPNLVVSNVTNTAFWGDTVDNNAAQTAMSNAAGLMDMVNGAYTNVSNNVTSQWYNDSGLQSPVTDFNSLPANPDVDAAYYLKITYPMDASSEESATNTKGNIAGTATIGGAGEAIALNDGKVLINGKETMNDSLMGQGYGTYTVHVVKGQLQITKTIDKQYTDIKQINANQTFVFKIERYEVNKDNNGNESKGDLAETFYETISFNANESRKEVTKTISGLKKGYYTVTEETSWSPKYTLKETSNNYNKSKNAENLFIGELQNNPVPANSKPQYYGLDNTQVSGKGIYSDYATGETAKTGFENDLKTKNDGWKWLSDTAAAVNVFNK